MQEQRLQESERHASRRRRRFRSQEEIQRILEEYRTSGMSQRAFCEARGISVSTLGSWIAKRREQQQPSSVQAPGLIPVRVKSPPRKDRPIEVVLGNDRIVRIHGDFDPEVLEKILQVVESSC